MLEELLLDKVDGELLQEVIRKHFKVATIVIVATCEIIYEGRASSHASAARRLLIIKEDGTLLIHEGSGVKPINWQPESSVSVKIYDNRIELIAIRSRPKEVVKVVIVDNPSIMVCKLGSGKFLMRGTEDELIQHIALNPSIIKSGAHLVAKEVTTPYGRVDVILRDSKGGLIVVECKRGVADVEAVHQLRRYVEYYNGLGLRAEGVLASPSVTPQALKLLVKYGLKHVEIKLPSKDG